MHIPIISKIAGISAGILETTGALTTTTATALSAMFRRRTEKGMVMRQLAIVSVDSLPVLALVSVLGGFVMIIESTWYVDSMGAYSLIGWAFGLVTLSQVAPILVALMFAARSGARTTAELSAMKITGQMDALALLAIDPVEYLAAPRYLAMILMLPLMIALCDVIAITSGAVGVVLLTEISPSLFWHSLVQGHLLDEFLLGVGKGFIFGLIVAAVSCTFGLRVKGGAAGAGRAVNDCVVVSALLIFVADFAFTLLTL